MDTRRTLAIFACTLLLTVLFAVPGLGSPQWFNGVASYEPANEYDAPIFRQFAFVEDTVTQYHVLSPDVFSTDDRQSYLYQFPMCQTLDPVLQQLPPIPGHPQGQTDSPTRHIVDVYLETGCSVQPKSEAEVEELALLQLKREMYVNAPVIPKTVEDWEDERLFNGPPFRPRVPAWQEGEPVKFITFETSWGAPWQGANFPHQDADVFIISYGSLFRPGFTIFNVADSSPMTDSWRSYSPIWRATCIADADDPKCMVSVNMRDPAYYQCRDVSECTNMVNSNGKPVVLVQPHSFRHINCPMVAVDLDGDDYINALEEIQFADLWIDGPVIL